MTKYLDQVINKDTNAVYPCRDAEARADINDIETYIERLHFSDFAVCLIESTGHGSDNRVCYTDLSIINWAGFDREKAGTAFRLHCKDGSFWSWTDEKLVYIHILGMEQAHFVPLYTDATKTEIATVGQLRNKTIDFVYICYNGDYENAQIYMVSSLAESADLSNYYTKTETDNLLSAKVSDNPTFTEAATRANIASGESFATILGKIKKFFSDLKAVAFSGSYNDLTDKPNLATVATSGNYSDLSGTPTLATVATSGDYGDLLNKPTIPAAQVNSDWSANSGVAEILNKPNLSAVATSGQYSDLSGTPNLATVATSGDYDDLINKPTIPTVTWRPIKVDIGATGHPNVITVRAANDDGEIKFARGANIHFVPDASNGEISISATDTKPTGYDDQTSLSAVPVPNSTSYTEIATVSLTAGTWIINWAASFPSIGSTNSGYRAAGFTPSTTGDPYAYMMIQVPAVTNNTFTCISSSFIYVATSNTTLRLKARQYQGTSGTSLNVTPRIQAIKIL